MRAWQETKSYGTVYGCHEDCAHEAHYALLKFFDEHEPAVAEAIRYGLTEAGKYLSKTRHIGGGILENTFGEKYVINYPEQTDSES